MLADDINRIMDIRCWREKLLELSSKSLHRGS